LETKIMIILKSMGGILILALLNRLQKNL